ncbi:MAG: hypothetical protein GXP03_08910 [Alphaproteobacteria bacterium]|nr:hypothetical protein [Alphaproteobacteria bacterium]
MFRILLILWLLPSLAFAGGDYSEPPRGSDLRRALMDAVRPHAVWNLGAPVEFVVEDLRVSGDIAYASLMPQRPGGGAIDFWQTPLMKRGEIDPEFYDGVAMVVLYQKSGATWVAVHWSIGSTDVWWAGPEFCAEFKAVTPEFCY